MRAAFLFPNSVTSCEALGGSCYFSKPQFPHLKEKSGIFQFYLCVSFSYLNFLINWAHLVKHIWTKQTLFLNPDP